MDNKLKSTIEVGMDNREAVEKTKQLGKAHEEAAKIASNSIDTLEQKLQQHGQTVEQLNQELVASTKRTAEQQIKINEEKIKKQIELEKQREQTQKTRLTGLSDLEDKRRERERESITLRNAGRIAGQRERTVTNIVTAEERRKTDVFRKELSERARHIQQYNRVLERAASVSEEVREKVFGTIGGATMHRRRDALMGFEGMTNREALSTQLSEVFSPDEALYLSGISSVRPISFGGRDIEGDRARRQADAEEQRYLREERAARRQLRREEALETRREKREADSIARQLRIADEFRAKNPGYMFFNEPIQGPMPETVTERTVRRQREREEARRRREEERLAKGGGRGRGNVFTRLLGAGGGGVAGGIAANIAGGLGIGIGAYGVMNAARAITDAEKQATAYDRQLVAAEKLAGSQEKLNSLLEAYHKASGGAVDMTTELSNVTRLLSTGYAESAEDVSRFVRATRGASIALGKPQDYVIQETQLAISNISVKRLDQIGLGIEEVNNRIEKLRSTNAGWTREMAFQDAVLSLMEEKYGSLTRTVEGQATGVERLGRAWRNLGLQIGQGVQGPVNTVAGGLAGLIESNLAEGDVYRSVRAEMDKNPAYKPDINASETERRIYALIQEEQALQSQRREFWDSITRAVLIAAGGAQFGESRSLQGTGPQFSGTVPSWMTSATGSAMPAPTLPSWRRLQENQQSVIESIFDQTTQLEKDYARQRLETIRQYEESRASLIRNFNKQTAREEEDFLRQRARSLRDYERAILDVMRDAQEREAEWQEDLDEKIADLKQEGNKKIAEMEEDYQEDREKAERRHRQRLLKAAGQLDAIAVLEERQRYRDEKKERDEAHKEAVEEQREALQEQIDEAIEAHQERLEDAREADRKRLEDMATARERQLADENEDREIRKNRAIEDHNDQLDEMDRLHGLTMDKMREQYEEQKGILEDALADELTALGFYIEGYLDKIKERDEAIDKWFQGVIDRLEDEIRAEEKRKKDETIYYPNNGQMGAYARGGFVPQTGPAMLHAGEYVLSREMLAAGWSPTGDSSYNNSRSIVIQSGAISVQTTPGYEHLVGDIVEQKVIELLERV